MIWDRLISRDRQFNRTRYIELGFHEEYPDGLLQEIMEDPNMASIHMCHRRRWFPLSWRCTTLEAPDDWPKRVAYKHGGNTAEDLLGPR